MSALLIKNVPPDLHAGLKERAARNHRSLTKEALAILEAALSADGRRLTLEQLDRRRVRGTRRITDRLIQRAKTAGRP